MKLTKEQKDIVKKLNSAVYTVEYIEDFTSRKDTVFSNAPVALIASSCIGFMSAVDQMIKEKV
jgi:hypothetical protein